MTKRFFIGLFSAALLSIASLQSCYYDKEDVLYPGSTQAVDCSTISAKFGADVSNIITRKCATADCHNPSSGRLVIQNYNQVHDVIDRIKARVIIEKTMPPAQPLTQSEINILKCWIESGAPNN